jgi:hypothetical protein
MRVTLEELIEVIHQSPHIDCGGGATAEELAQAQADLGIIIPGCYGMILRLFGWLSVGSWELFGLGSQTPPHLHLVAMVTEERRSSRRSLPISLLPVMNNGGGDLFCLELESADAEGDCPVRLWDHRLGLVNPWDSGLIVPDESESFCTWLANAVRGEFEAETSI